ncbi:MAG: DNA mismatch repair endonuclease MutL [Chloroflexi bacterium]|nr:DNA mismatch repair endonuclease MutL [Chloroflexota bacterium]
MPIQILSTEVTALIAAGEVVERPASVVKELVENALDAGAKQITVELVDGGKQLIRVSDDGCGIPETELPLAVARYATSKLTSLDDLSRLYTLGFRGEALASVAAVSRLELCSRAISASRAAEIVVEGGAEIQRGPAARAPGTSVAVRGLFRSTPARFKFLRSTLTEAGRVHMVVAAYALAWPEVRFALAVDGREALRTSGGGDARTVLAELLDCPPDQLLDLQCSSRTDVRVHGAVGVPTLSRSTREHLWVFVNRRWVTHRGVSAAVLNAYRTLLQVGRYPVGVVFVEVPAHLVDVNVHPAKAEVRFARDRDVYGAVYEAVHVALLGHPVVPELGSAVSSLPHDVFSPSTLPDPEIGAEGPVTWEELGGELPQRPGGTSFPLSGGAVTGPNQVPFPRMPVLRVLGQVDSSYIITEGPEGLYLIDQHAAHERILYDRLRQEVRGGAPPQALLTPAVVEVNPRQLAVLHGQLELLSRLGFVIEPFGSTSLLLRAVPTVLTDTDPVRVLVEVLDEVSEEHRQGAGYEEATLWSVACRSAIKANQPLSQEEMEELVRQLEVTTSPQTCAHGRPTMIHLSVSQLERQFGRR